MISQLCVYVCVCVCTHTRLVTQSCPTLCYPMNCSPPSFSVHGVLQGKIPEWVLQGIFLSQGLNPGLPHCRRILCHLSHQGSPPSCIIISNLDSLPFNVKYEFILRNCTFYKNTALSEQLERPFFNSLF